MLRKSRNGNRRLGIRLRQPLGRRTWRRAGKPASNLSRIDYLATACKAVSDLIRFEKRLAKEAPHIYGPHARKYFLDTLEMEKWEQEFEAALARVRGSPSTHVSTLWQGRYCPKPETNQMFLKWFHENYTNRRGRG